MQQATGLAAIAWLVATIALGITSVPMTVLGIWLLGFMNRRPLLLSEIFPMTIRGFAMGIAVFVLWCVNALISFVFPNLNKALGSTGTFGIFVVVNLVSIWFVWKFAPETRGR